MKGTIVKKLIFSDDIGPVTIGEETNVHAIRPNEQHCNTTGSRPNGTYINMEIIKGMTTGETRQLNAGELEQVNAWKYYDECKQDNGL